MESIGVLTFLHNDNFGSALQAFALQEILNDMGYDCVHIDYRPDTREKIMNLLKNRNSPKLLVDGLRKRSVKAGQENARKKSAGFTDFYRRRMRLTECCRNTAQLREVSTGFDTVMCGSDQIWSPVWMNRAYFLDFVPEQKTKIAYAASLGVSECGNRFKKKRIAALVKTFDAVSVREEEGARVLHDIAGISPDVMPDPVCLLKRSAWESVAEMPETEEKYILCYFIGNSDQYRSKVDALAAETGLAVRVIPVTVQDYYSGRELLDALTPEQFLGYIAKADMVCTDSFHGTALAMIFGKPCEVIRRYREDDPESKNSRIDQLARRLGMESGKRDQPWDVIDRNLEQARIEGRNWLKASLEKKR